MAMGNKIEAEMYSKDSFKKDYFTCNTREGEKKNILVRSYSLAGTNNI